MKTSLIILMGYALLLTACSKKSDDVTPPQIPGEVKPSTITLSIPADNENCSSGVALTGNKSIITFNWLAVEKARVYEILITNLLTKTTVSRSSATNSLKDTLLTGTPYYWQVTSSNAELYAGSAVWKFFVSGPGTSTSAPNPPVLSSPANGAWLSSPANNEVSLYWQNSAQDNTGDITFDVYLGTTTSPPLIASNQIYASLDKVKVERNKIYYWRVAARNADGNTATSATFQFSVN